LRLSVVAGSGREASGAWSRRSRSGRSRPASSAVASTSSPRAGIRRRTRGGVHSRSGQGGLGIWGGIAAGTLTGIWVLHRRGADIPRFLDAAAPGLLVAQAIGRIGNYFNQELFGGPTNLPWGLHIDLAHRPAGYAAYTTFHPTFLYELIWNLALAGVLVLLGRTGRIRPPGLFALYVAGYSGFRIFEETLRVDPAHHYLGLRLNFYVASLLCAGGLAWFARTQRAGWKARGPTLLAAAWLACVVAGCGHSAIGH
jgi:prolipoprotein diacylglyceryltransferase